MRGQHPGEHLRDWGCDEIGFVYFVLEAVTVIQLKYFVQNTSV